MPEATPNFGEPWPSEQRPIDLDRARNAVQAVAAERRELAGKLTRDGTQPD